MAPPSSTSQPDGDQTTIERRGFLATAVRLIASVGLGILGCTDAQSSTTSPADLPTTGAGT